MNELIMTIGLPRSGKSTWAKEQGIPIVSCDAIRQSMGVYPFVPAAEPIVWTTARYMVKALFFAGHTKVILDTTAITKKRRDEWINDKWIRRFHVFPTPQSDCIERARTTNQEYLIPIIEVMAEQYETVSSAEYAEWEREK